MSLSQAQRDFLELLVARQALKFGDFTLKSGRKSPFFINTGCFYQGSDIAKLGRAYADAIQRRLGNDVEIIFGPAYKGVPLALSTAQEYEKLTSKPVGWAFDRKEAKDHGDGGLFVGAPLSTGSKVVMVDDVITNGAAKREALAKLAPTGVTVSGVVVAVDRQEKGLSNLTALEELGQEYKLPVFAIITITEAVDYLSNNDVGGKRYLTPELTERIRGYLAQATR